MEGQAPAASALQLSTFTKVQSIPRPDRFPDFPVTVRLAAPGADQTVRAPIDIVVALDVSMSSKTNDPMLELEKAALALVIEKLDDSDRLAVLPFYDRVAQDEPAKAMAELVTMSKEGKEKIGGLVKARKYVPGGGTTIVKALDRSEKILTERGDADRAGFIVLLSDGGDKTVLQEKVWSRESALKDPVPKYPVHTFGFTDHNRDTMRHIADRTSGTYFADDIAGGDDLKKFAAGFEGLLSKATTQPFSAVRASANLVSAHPGVSILRVDSGEKKASINGDGRSGEVDIGVIIAGGTTEFMVYLDVPEGDADADAMEVLAVDGAYTQAWDGKPVKLGRSVVSVNRPVPTPDPEQPVPKAPTTPVETEPPVAPPPTTPVEPEPAVPPAPKTPVEPEPAVPPAPAPRKPERPVTPQDPCKELDRISERLEYWCKVKAELSAMYEEEQAEAGAATKCQCHFTAALREAGLESINRAMHHDIYTAVVRAIKLRRCGDGNGDKAEEH